MRRLIHPSLPLAIGLCFSLACVAVAAVAADATWPREMNTDQGVLRFSELERAIPAISQKMLIQQLRQLEADAIVSRIVHHQVPPKVEYCLTGWGQALCPVLDALLKWAASRGKFDSPKKPRQKTASNTQTDS
jgi:DNA-binding HxlR family transcriptional regulator